MVSAALFLRLEAKQGKESEVEQFLRNGLPLVQAEQGTVAWFGIRIDHGTFAIFDAFADDADREAHLGGLLAEALMAKASNLLQRPPVVERADVLAAKLP